VNIALWIIQGLLAALFLFGGAAKLTIPVDELAKSGMPGLFLQFIGIAEVLGAIGLVVPGIVRIRPGLTPLAAAGLVIIMIGATVTVAMGVGGGDPIGAVVPLVVGLLTAFVGYGRRNAVPHQERSHQPVLQPAS
jgi:hypothetical protein